MCSGRFSRVAVALSAIACLFSAGCIPYAYPKLSYVPGTELGPEVGDVRAFRVDGAMSLPAFGISGCEHKLTEIAPTADGALPSQMRVTLERGTAHPTGGFYYFSGGRVHETRVRLYRPGYQLVELNPWEFTDKLAWQPAPDWRAQVRALTDLIGPPRLTPSPSGAVHRADDSPLPSINPSLQPYSDFAWDHRLPLAPVTPESKRAFDFAIFECERLEKCAPTPEDAARVRELAQKLRKRQFDAVRGSKQ